MELLWHTESKGHVAIQGIRSATEVHRIGMRSGLGITDNSSDGRGHVRCAADLEICELLKFIIE